jgi:hypothetical protein
MGVQFKELEAELQQVLAQFCAEPDPLRQSVDAALDAST